MSGTHGDLYSEIGELVFAANSGQALDLAATSEELSQRYANLNVPPDAMARAIARCLGAVGVSMALLKRPKQHAEDRLVSRIASDSHAADEHSGASLGRGDDELRSPSLFPSGVRLALLS